MKCVYLLACYINKLAVISGPPPHSLSPMGKKIFMVLWSMWVMDGLSSLTWPESDWLDSGAGWGCTLVVHWAINVHGLNQPSTHKLWELYWMATSAPVSLSINLCNKPVLQHHHPASLSVEVAVWLWLLDSLSMSVQCAFFSCKIVIDWGLLCR